MAAARNTTEQAPPADTAPQSDPASMAMRELGPNRIPLLSDDDVRACFATILEAATKGKQLNAALWVMNRHEDASKTAARGSGTSRKAASEAGGDEPSGPRPVSILDRMEAQRKGRQRPEG